MLFLYIFGPIVFTTLVVVGQQYLKRRAQERKAAEDQAKKDKRFNALLAEARSGDHRAQERLADGGWRLKNPESNPKITAFLEANKKEVEARRHETMLRGEWEIMGKPVKNAYEAWQKAVGTKEEPYLCAAFVRKYWKDSKDFSPKLRERLKKETGFTPEEASAVLDALVHNRYEMLAAKLEDEESFHELQQLVLQTRERYSDIRNAGIKDLLYPEGWNKAAARFLENPSVGDFAELGDGPAPGQVLQWGEEALRDSDIVKVKLVLAYAAKDHYWRREIGGALNHELGQLVADYHASLAVKTSAPTESV